MLDTTAANLPRCVRYTIYSTIDVVMIGRKLVTF
jgi:hypothetical protein